jgi:hypothetical protein
VGEGKVGKGDGRTDEVTVAGFKGNFLQNLTLEPHPFIPSPKMGREGLEVKKLKKLKLQMY